MKLHMIDHMTLTSGTYEKSKIFYSKVLAPLGYTMMREYGNDVAGFGIGERVDFWLANGAKATAPVFHIAFAAQTRAQVDEFYKAALAAGGKDNGAPGIREHYSPTYYTAFVYDLDGQNIEVCHRG